MHPANPLAIFTSCPYRQAKHRLISCYSYLSAYTMCDQKMSGLSLLKLVPLRPDTASPVILPVFEASWKSWSLLFFFNSDYIIKSLPPGKEFDFWNQIRATLVWYGKEGVARTSVVWFLARNTCIDKDEWVWTLLWSRNQSTGLHFWKCFRYVSCCRHRRLSVQKCWFTVYLYGTLSWCTVPSLSKNKTRNVRYLFETHSNVWIFYIVPSANARFKMS
jgi:hypothetical protein